MRITVVQASPQKQSTVALEVEPGATLQQVVERSGLWTQPTPPQVGVFGRCRGMQETVSEGDRVEIYRPLLLSPREQRRRRVLKKT